jgi:hypothetical protein
LPFLAREKFTFLHVTVGIAVSFGAVNFPEKIWDMNEIVLK